MQLLIHLYSANTGKVARDWNLSNSSLPTIALHLQITESSFSMGRPQISTNQNVYFSIFLSH